MGTLSLSLQCKLGSLIVHAKEAFSGKGHPFDVIEFEELLKDEEIAKWMEELDREGLLPKER